MHLDSTTEDHRVDTPVRITRGTRSVLVEEGVTIDGTVGYSLIGLGALFAAPGAYLLIAAQCDETDRMCVSTPIVGGVLATLGGALMLTGFYMITFGNPYELYGADVRRDTRPAVSPAPEIEIGDPVGNPPQDQSIDEGATQPGEAPPTPESSTETEAEGDAEAEPEDTPPLPTPSPSSSKTSGALGIGGPGLLFSLWF
jgi:hypothetical protein